MPLIAPLTPFIVAACASWYYAGKNRKKQRRQARQRAERQRRAAQTRIERVLEAARREAERHARRASERTEKRLAAQFQRRLAMNLSHRDSVVAELRRLRARKTRIQHTAGLSARRELALLEQAIHSARAEMKQLKNHRRRLRAARDRA